MKLDFIIAGAQKCGTTTLHGHLRDHSDVFMPPSPQELHYFDDDSNYAKGMSWYTSHFEDYSAETLTGQTSPLYIYAPDTAVRIYEAFPEVKLIFILRNPAARAYSHYYHSLKKGYETLSFEDALQAEHERTQIDIQNRNRYSYRDRGFYHKQLSVYLKYFQKTQIKIILLEELKSNPEKQLHSLCHFLSIEPESPLKSMTQSGQRNQSKLPRFLKLQQFAAKKRHKFPRLCRKIDHYNLVAKPYPSIKPDTKEALDQCYREDIQQLSNTFQIDLSAWIGEDGSHLTK